MKSLACPDRRDLERLVLGQLTETESEKLSAHILDCGTCAEFLNSLHTPDHLVSDLRAFGQLQPTLSDGDALIERLVHRSETPTPCTEGAAASLDGRTTVPTVVSKGPPPAVPNELPAINGYEVMRVLGRGGMGVVYQVRQLGLKRLVALKMIRAGTHAGDQARARFRTEAEAVAALQHPNIVQIHDIGEQEGCPFFSLEYVEGGSLDRKLAEGPLSFAGAARLVEILARAMHHCHQRGIIHRDLKPANVLLAPDGTPKITDFGLAKQLADDVGQTQSGAIMGTPCYMAPEQATGQVRAIGPATDVYALGAILYELLAGRPPFQGDSTASVLEQVRTQEPVPPSRLRGRVPRDLETVCLKALAKEPGQRYNSALTLAQDLERFQAGEPILARREWAAQKVLRKLFRHRIAAACVLVALAGAGAVAVMAVARSTRTDALVGRIDAELLEPKRTEAYLDQMGSQIDDLRERNADRARVADQKLRRAVADLIINQVRQPHVSAEELAGIGAFLDVLERRGWGETVPELRQELKVRRGAWETVFDLVPPFRGSDSVFDAGAVAVKGGALVAAATRPPASATLSNAVFTRKSCVGNVELEAVFPPGWDSASELGLSFAGYPGHTESITALAFCPDGRTLVSASGAKDRYGEVRFWDFVETVERAAYRAERPGKLSVAVARDGRVAVANSNDPVVRLLDPATGKVLTNFKAHDTGVAALAFSPDGKTLATGGGVPAKSGEVCFWDTATWQPRGTLTGHDDVIVQVAYSADGRHLATGGPDRTVILWDLANGKRIVSTFPCWKESPPTLCFPPGGKTFLATARPDKDTDKILGMRIIEWNLADGSPLRYRRLVNPAAAYALACSPDGVFMAASSFWGECDVCMGRGGNVTEAAWDRVRNMRAAQVPFFLRGKPPGRDRLYTALEFTPDSSALVAGGSDGSVEVWDLATGRLRASFQGEGYSFVIRSPGTVTRPDHEPVPPPSMKTVRKSRGKLLVQILRNSNRLREEEVPATYISDGSLRLLARRVGNRLTFRVNQLPALEFEEVIPLWSATSSVFGLRWPGGTRVEQVRALRQGTPAAPSLLEEGDEHYTRGRYGDALRCYREQMRAAGSGEAGEAARVKAALAYEHREQVREATDLLEYVVTNGGKRWALIAACNLLRLQVERGDNLGAADLVLDQLGKRFEKADLLQHIPADFGERLAERCSPKLLWLYLAPAPAPLRRTAERAAAIQEIFGGRPDVRRQVLWTCVLAFHYAGLTDRALPAAERLLADQELGSTQGKHTTWGQVAFSELMEQYCWLQRERGQSALKRLDKELFRKPDQPDPTLADLFLTRARIHYAQRQWDRAEQDVEAYLRLAPKDDWAFRHAPRAGLMLGFLRERRGDSTGALQAWQQGLREAGPRQDDWKRSAEDINASQMDAIILAALTGQMTDGQAGSYLDAFLERAKGRLPAVVVRESEKLTPRTVLRDMWLTARGRDCARHFAFLDVTFAEAQRIPWLLTVAESIHQTVLPGEMSADQDQVVWQLVSELHTAYISEKLSIFQMASLVLTWKGTTSALGWDGVSAKLPGDLRGPLAYVFGRRFQQLKKPKEAEGFYRAALKDAPADSPLRRLVQGVLDRKEYEQAIPVPKAPTPSDNARRMSIAELSQIIRLMPNDYRAYVGRALAYEEKKEYDKAIADYTEAIRLKPTEPLLHAQRGNAHNRVAQYDKAIADANEAIRLGKTSAYNLRGVAYRGKKDYDKAIADFGECIRLNPRYADPLFQRGLVYDQKGEHGKAIADYTQTIGIDPESAPAVYYLCRASARSSMHGMKEAIPDITEAIRREPTASSYALRGGTYAVLGDHDNAIANYTEAIRLEPTEPKHHAARGNAYYSVKEYDEAIADYTEAIRLKPKENSFYCERGLAYFAKKDYDKAIADCTEAIRLEPKNPAAFRRRGGVYTEKRDYDKAIADCTQTIRLDPNSAAGYLGRGYAHAKRRDHDNAVTDFTEAIRLDPNAPRAYFERAGSYTEQGEHDKAIADCTEAARLNPRYALAFLRRGILYAGKRELDRAIADASETIRLDPKNFPAFHLRGIVYTQKGQTDKAVADLTEAIRLNPGFVEAYLERAGLFGRQKEYEKAAADYTQAVRLAPENAGANNDFAWLLATCPKDGIRDGKKAVGYATKANEAQKTATHLDTLAAAHAECGDFKEAVRRQKEAIGLGYGSPEATEQARQRLKLYEEGKPYREK